MAKGIEQVGAARSARIREAWAREHPDIARDERRLHKDQARRRERWKHKREGTPETHEHASRVRQGVLARLALAGDLTLDQLAAAEDIRRVHERIAGDVRIGTVSLETRVDRSPGGDGFYEALGAVRSEIAYTRWRAALPIAGPVLALVIEEQGLAAVSRRWRMRNARAKVVLGAALDLWGAIRAGVCREIDDTALAAAHAAIL